MIFRGDITAGLGCNRATLGNLWMKHVWDLLLKKKKNTREESGKVGGAQTKSERPHIDHMLKLSDKNMEGSCTNGTFAYMCDL